MVGHVRDGEVDLHGEQVPHLAGTHGVRRDPYVEPQEVVDRPAQTLEEQTEPVARQV